MAKITIDQVIGAYVATRDKIADLEAQISELKVFQARKEEYMLNLLTTAGAQNIKTSHGTVYTMVKESVTVADPDVFFQWVKDNDRFECLERRAAKNAVLDLMGEREENGRPNPAPAGLNYVAIRGIGVRKS